MIEPRHKLNQQKRNMNISLLMLINMAFACKYDMGGESRTRVCANCRDKSVIGKLKCSQNIFKTENFS